MDLHLYDTVRHNTTRHDTGSFCDLHFIYFGYVFMSHLSLITSLHIVIVCALFSLLFPCDGLEKFCYHCFVVNFEVLRTCSFTLFLCALRHY